MKIDRKTIIKRLDKLRQTCARYEGAKKKNGVWINTCVTCRKPVPCDKANGGHFIPRACYPLRWDEKNVHCQCVHCNLYNNGAYLEYSQWFLEKNGPSCFERYVNTLRDWKAGKLPTVKMEELKSIYDYWLAKGRELEKKVGPLFPKTWEPFGPDFLPQ